MIQILQNKKGTVPTFTSNNFVSNLVKASSVLLVMCYYWLQFQFFFSLQLLRPECSTDGGLRSNLKLKEKRTVTVSQGITFMPRINQSGIKPQALKTFYARIKKSRFLLQTVM